MSKRFRIEQLRSNIASPAGALYPEEVMQEIVREASERVAADQLFVCADAPAGVPDLANTLAVVSEIELVAGWIEIAFVFIKTDKARTIEVLGFEGIQIVPNMEVSRSSHEGILIVHEAKLTHFVVNALPTIDLSTGKPYDHTLYNTFPYSKGDSNA